MEWPYDDWYFLRRCVAIWNQRGAHATVTWEWPEGLSCPNYGTSVALLEELTYARHLRVMIASWTAFTVLSVVALGVGCHTRRRSKCVCYN